MKQDKGDKIIQKAERRAQKAAQKVEAASKKAEAARAKQAARAQKKAAKLAANAEKKAAAKNKKAEAVSKKAQLAAQKAEEKKMKALAKASETRGDEDDEGEAAAPKKKSKKKLLMIAIPVVAVAVGAGAFFFLRGGGEEDEDLPPEPITIPLEYILNEQSITALPVWGSDVLVYQEEIVPEPPAPPEGSDGEEGEEAAQAEEEGFTKILYRYEGLQAPVNLISAYTALMTTEDAGFSIVDETLLRIDPPEEFAQSGAVQIARNMTEESGGGVQSLLLSWTETDCSVTLDMPEGKVHDPKAAAPASPLAPHRGISDLEEMHPSKLGLPGDSMDAYDILTQDGSVRIAGVPCARVNIYDGNGQIAGSYFVSSDGHLYKLDEASNGVIELDWE